MKKNRIILISIIVVILIGAATGSVLYFQNKNAERALSATELLDLGEKYLRELNYEQAIVYLIASIEIEPRTEKVYILLAEAYKQSGEPQKGQAVLEMGFALFYDDALILEKLLDSMIDNGDATAVGRLVADVQRIGNIGTMGIRNSLQKLINSDDELFIIELIAVLYEQDGNSALALSLELWLIINKEYDSDTELQNAINKLLEERENSIPKLNAGEEFYLGEYDEEGKRSGFGIAFYGDGVKLDSTMYIGYWDNDVRSGEGTAYKEYISNYIKGFWASDLPNGRCHYTFDNYWTSRESEFRDGLGYGEVLSFHNDRLVCRDLIAKTDVVQTFTTNRDLFLFIDIDEDGNEAEPGPCPCTHFQWDARYNEGGN